nr:FAD-dependent oxidoreductase [Actinomadura madurae]
MAAGMLTPVSELTYGEEPLLRLGLASRDRYGAFVAELEEQTGLETGYRTDGIIEVAFGPDDLAYLDDLRRFQESLGIPVETLSGRECRRAEPMLAPGVRGGLLAPEDGSIDPRRLTPALLAAGERLGVRLVRRRATGIVTERDAATGVRLDDGTVLRADRVLLAAARGRTASTACPRDRSTRPPGEGAGDPAPRPHALPPPFHPRAREGLVGVPRPARRRRGRPRRDAGGAGLRHPRHRRAGSGSCCGTPASCCPASPSWSSPRSRPGCAPAPPTTRP